MSGKKEELVPCFETFVSKQLFVKRKIVFAPSFFVISCLLETFDWFFNQFNKKKVIGVVSVAKKY